MSTTTRSHRPAGIAGVLFFVLMIARVILSPDEGEVGDTPAAIAAKVHAHATGILIDDWAGGVAALLFVAFAVGLAGALRDAGARRELPALVVGGAVAVLALASVQHALSATLAFSVADLGQPALTRTMFDLSTLVESTLYLPIALTLAAASIAALGTGVLSRRLALAGLRCGGAQRRRRGRPRPHGDPGRGRPAQRPEPDHVPALDAARRPRPAATRGAGRRRPGDVAHAGARGRSPLTARPARAPRRTCRGPFPPTPNQPRFPCSITT